MLSTLRWGGGGGGGGEICLKIFVNGCSLAACLTMNKSPNMSLSLSDIDISLKTMSLPEEENLKKKNHAVKSEEEVTRPALIHFSQSN